MALWICLNYVYGWEPQVAELPFLQRWLAWCGITAIPFFLPYLLIGRTLRRNLFRERGFLALLVVAPLIFSLKIALPAIDYLPAVSDRNVFWNHVLYWPGLLTLTVFLLWLTWTGSGRPATFFGLRPKGWHWQPYGWMLLMMIPLITWAATQPDFQSVYPKIATVENLIQSGAAGWMERIAYELGYGSDFLTIELFFRGFLVLAFIRWAGTDAILPMACFYCTIHFGKPLAECISSYFGGLLLGIVAYHNRSIYGGLMVHLGIAWMMEAGGYWGRMYFSG
ncbi:MAG: hypothetical protein RJA57_742 [Bacteroidota bacterium]|jgi:hypothetical protein